MKQYVLDDLPKPQAFGDAAAPASRQRRWRLLAALAIIEPLVLAAFYVAVAGGPNPGVAAEGTAQREAEARAAHRPPAAPLPAPAPTAQPHAGAAPPAASTTFSVAPPASGDDAEAQPATKTSRIAHHGGKWIVELHGADVRSTLALLSATTRATVTGAEVIVGNPVRIQRELVAASPTEAWKAVFGDLANFAITCAAPGCTVHFASAVPPAPTAAAAAPAAMAAAAITQPYIAPPMAELPAPRPAVAARVAPQATTDTGDPSAAEN